MLFCNFNVEDSQKMLRLFLLASEKAFLLGAKLDDYYTQRPIQMLQSFMQNLRDPGLITMIRNFMKNPDAYGTKTTRFLRYNR